MKTPRQRAEQVFADMENGKGGLLFEETDWMNPEDKEPLIAAIEQAIVEALRETPVTAQMRGSYVRPVYPVTEDD